MHLSLTTKTSLLIYEYTGAPLLKDQNRRSSISFTHCSVEWDTLEDDVDVPPSETSSEDGEPLDLETAPAPAGRPSIMKRTSSRKPRDDTHIVGASLVLRHTSSRSVRQEVPEICTDNPIASTEERAISSPFITYEQFMWVFFTVLTVVAIIDRFTWNVWPRQVFSIGSGNAGSDRLVGYKPGPWSVVLYDVLARISGRYSIICYNFLLLTRLQMLEDFLSNSFIAKYLLDCTDMVNANVRMHKTSGIGLCVLTLLHVWSILFPCIFHGYTAKVIPGVFEWPLSERTPTKCSVEDFEGCWPGDANTDLKQMGLEIDDVFRMVEMTVFLGILLPLSVSWLTSHWHAAIQLHRFINIVYFVDIVRRHTHPHSWILNTPMFVLYLIDKIVFSNYWHRNETPEVHKVVLSKDFMVLYWKSPFGKTNTVGPDYALRLNDSPFLESKHTFTCFENRANTELGDIADEFNWSVGVVIRVFRRDRIPAIASDVKSHTGRMYDEPCDMLITGPRQGEMSEALRYALLAATKQSQLVIFGAGSAINFILDSLQFCSVTKAHRPNVSILYTTRDLALFEWVHEVVSRLVPLCEQNGFVFKLTIAFTGSLQKAAPTKRVRQTILSAAWFQKLAEEAAEKSEFVTLARNRIDLNASILPGSTVFCQGSAGLKNSVKTVCKKVNATLYLGRGGSREDQV